MLRILGYAGLIVTLAFVLLCCLIVWAAWTVKIPQGTDLRLG